MLAQPMEHVGIAAWLLPKFAAALGKSSIPGNSEGSPMQNKEKGAGSICGTWLQDRTLGTSLPLLICLVLYIFLAKDCKKIAT